MNKLNKEDVVVLKSKQKSKQDDVSMVDAAIENEMTDNVESEVVDSEVIDTEVIDTEANGSDSVDSDDSDAVDSDTVADNDDSEEDVFDKGHWYIVQCFTGHEYKVQQHIQVLIDHPEYKQYLYRVLVPVEETVEIKNNKRVEKIVRMYPGYVFVQMESNDHVCYEIRKVPGVAKFIGGTKSEPTPVSDIDILKVLRKVGDKTKTIDVDFEEKEEIKVIDGPFRGYVGIISEINVDRGSLKVQISIFGRETPVELNFDQVEKIV
jgi:transcriptional antiterminator NusG